MIGKTELERLYREYLPFVLAFCLKRLGNQSEAEDAAEEVFRKVASVREWTMPTRPKAYLAKAASNVVLDVVRKRKAGLGIAADPKDPAALGKQADLLNRLATRKIVDDARTFLTAREQRIEQCEWKKEQGLLDPDAAAAELGITSGTLGKKLNDRTPLEDAVIAACLLADLTEGVLRCGRLTEILGRGEEPDRKRKEVAKHRGKCKNCASHVTEVRSRISTALYAIPVLFIVSRIWRHSNTGARPSSNWVRPRLSGPPRAWPTTAAAIRVVTWGNVWLGACVRRGAAAC